MKYKAVIFDFDGVIGKTMEDNYRAWAKAFNRHGVSIEREDYFLLEGMSGVAVAEHILSSNDMDSSLATAIAALKEQYYLEENSFEFYPAVLELIEALRDRFKLGLVSGAGSMRLENTVSDEFLIKFETVVTGDSVKNSKPHPEPYLLAARRLEVEPPSCVAVENAPLGIESAKKAEMVCVAVCSTLPRKHLGQADFIVEDIDSLYTFFDNING